MNFVKARRLAFLGRISVAVFMLSSSEIRAGAPDKFKILVVEASGSITTGQYGFGTDATAKVILPNGDHAYLMCAGRDGHCAKIESLLPPEKRKEEDTKCGTVGDVYVCITKNLGEYEASRTGNVITVVAPNGKLKFKVISSW